MRSATAQQIKARDEAGAEAYERYAAGRREERNAEMRSCGAALAKVRSATAQQIKARDEADAEAYERYAAGRREERNAEMRSCGASNTKVGVGVGL